MSVNDAHIWRATSFAEVILFPKPKPCSVNQRFGKGQALHVTSSLREALLMRSKIRGINNLEFKLFAVGRRTDSFTTFCFESTSSLLNKHMQNNDAGINLKQVMQQS